MGLFNRAAKLEREAAEAERLREEEQNRVHGGYIVPADVVLPAEGPVAMSSLDVPPEPLTAPASESPEDWFKFELEQWIDRAEGVWERTNADEFTEDVIAEIGSPPSVDTTGLVGRDRSMLIAACRAWANGMMQIQIQKTQAPFWVNAKPYMLSAIEIK